MTATMSMTFNECRIRVYPGAYAGTARVEPYWLEAGAGSDADWLGTEQEARAEVARLSALEPTELAHGHYSTPTYRVYRPATRAT